jgi:hypothetical protein
MTEAGRKPPDPTGGFWPKAAFTFKPLTRGLTSLGDHLRARILPPGFAVTLAKPRGYPLPSCTHPTTTLPSPPSLPIQRPGLITRQDAGAPSAPKTRFAGVFFRLSFRAMAAVRGRPSGLPGSCISGLSACAQLPPNSPDNECGSSHLIREFYR